MKKITLFLSLIIVLVISGLLLAKGVEAGNEHNVAGWAWADPETIPSGDPSGTNFDIGWISFNCYNDYNGDGVLEDHCSGKDYGVNVDLSNGKFSGRAWSGGGDGTNPNQGVGWISFERSETGAPPYDDPCPDGSCIAKLNPDNTVSGWARACGTPPGGVFQCGGGGWDGWIKLKGFIDANQNGIKDPGEGDYGVSRDTASTPHELTGWAWAGNDIPEEAVIGWISFNCKNQGVCATSNYKVFIRNAPPSATGLTVTQGDYCFATSPSVFLNWTFSDPGDTQSAYQVQVATDSGFTSLVVDSGQVTSGSTTYTPLGLDFGTTYYWRVKLWDSQGLISDCGNPDGWCYPPNDPSILPFPTPPPGSSFTTLPRPPWPDFTWSPLSPSAEEVVQFTDQSTCYDIDSTCNNWAWDFRDGFTCSGPPPTGNCGDSDFQNPKHVYTTPSPPPYSVTLTVSDNNGSCTKTHDLTITPPLPEWREIPPTGWILPKLVFQNLGKFLNSIFGFLI